MESWSGRLAGQSFGISSILSLTFGALRAGVRNRAAGVDDGMLCVAVGLGVEENVNRGVVLNCCVFAGQGVDSCASCDRGGGGGGGGGCFLITNR